MDLVFGKDEGIAITRKLQTVTGTGFVHLPYFSWELSIKLRVRVWNANDYKEQVITPSFNVLICSRMT